MPNIAEIKVISVDLFRTLAKVDDGYSQVWRQFLGDHYTDELGRRHWAGATEILLANLDEAARRPIPFKNTRAIFIESYAAYFRQIGLDFDPARAAEALFEIHRLEYFFPDARPFLEQVSRRFQVCLSTDSDTRMLEGIDRLFKFEKIFVSEQLRVYKAHPRFFIQVLDYYHLHPANILHIGDSRADILTPGRLGVQTCWLNRAGLTWKYPVKPDYEVKSLLEIPDILHLN